MTACIVDFCRHDRTWWLFPCPVICCGSGDLDFFVMIFQKDYTLDIDPRPSLFSVPLVAVLLAVLGGGERASAQDAASAADIDNNRVVNGADLETLLSLWGPCAGGTSGCLADLDNNAVVDGVDLGRLLALWGPCGPDVPAWKESIDGPLSGTMSAPTPATFRAGDNRIIVSLHRFRGQVDYVLD